MTAPEPNYVHRARLARQDEIPVKGNAVHDGDSFWLVLDLGTYSTVKVPLVLYIRLKGIDTWELDDPQGRGVVARDQVYAWLATAKAIRVATEKPPPLVGPLGATLGRTLAQVWFDGYSLAEQLLAGGHAKDDQHLG